ncbi:unnamed protein product [Pedinophyceae sp. YPF-701]|nr:unnamed protein product [Pedinophyceae sp. YPF-701]
MGNSAAAQKQRRANMPDAVDVVTGALDAAAQAADSLGALAAPLTCGLRLVKSIIDTCAAVQEHNDAVARLRVALPGVAAILDDLARRGESVATNEALAAALEALNRALSLCFSRVEKWQRKGKLMKGLQVKKWSMKLATATGDISLSLQQIAACGVALTQDALAEIVHVRRDVLCVVDGVDELLSAAEENKQVQELILQKLAVIESTAGGVSSEQVAALTAELRACKGMRTQDVEALFERHVRQAVAVRDGQHARQIDRLHDKIAELCEGVGAGRVRPEELEGAIERIVAGKLEPMLQRLLQQNTADMRDSAMEAAMKVVGRVQEDVDKQMAKLRAKGSAGSKKQIEEVAAATQGAVRNQKRRLEVRAGAMVIPPSEVKLGPILSRTGGFADVYHGEWTPADCVAIPVAVKVLETRDIADREKQACLREAEVLFRALSYSDRVCRLFGYVDDVAGGRVMLVMRKYTGSAQSMIARANGPLAPHEWARILADVTQALVDLHAAGMAHMDIKPANVLVEVTGRAVLADFGLARLVQSSLPSLPTVLANARTPYYAAPEQQSYRLKAARGPPSDIWSFAATAIHMATGRPPFANETHEDIKEMVLDGEKPAIPPGVFCTELESCLRACFSKAVGERPVAASVRGAVEAQLQALGTCDDEEEDADADEDFAAQLIDALNAAGVIGGVEAAQLAARKFGLDGWEAAARLTVKNWRAMGLPEKHARVAMDVVRRHAGAGGKETMTGEVDETTVRGHDAATRSTSAGAKSEQQMATRRTGLNKLL